MKTFIFCCLLLISSTALRAQDEALTKQMTRDWLNSGGAATASANGSVMAIKGPDRKLLGNGYLDSTFQTGYVVFYNKLQLPDNPPGSVLRDIPVRLDLNTNEVEIRTKSQGVRVATLGMVQALGIRSTASTDTNWFVNVREFSLQPGSDKSPTGFFEQVAVGRLSLLRYHSLYLKRANYNVAMNIGSRDDELVQQTEWYVARGRRVQAFSPGKKALISLMGDKAPEIEAYLKSQKPDLKNPSVLKLVFLYYNSL